MSKDSKEERDDEIIVSFTKTPPPVPAVATMSGARDAADGSVVGTNFRTAVGGDEHRSGRLPLAKEGADEVVARISSERVVAAPIPLQRASAGEEQSRPPPSVAPKSVLVLIGGRCTRAAALFGVFHVHELTGLCTCFTTKTVCFRRSHRE